MFTMLLLLSLLLFPVGVLVARTCHDELKGARKSATIILAASLLLALALLAYWLLPLWLQITLLVLLLLGCYYFSPLALFRWILAPLVLFGWLVPENVALWTSAFLIVATLAAATLFAAGLKKGDWKQHLKTSLLWFVPYYIVTGLIVYGMMVLF